MIENIESAVSGFGGDVQESVFGVQASIGERDVSGGNGAGERNLDGNGKTTMERQRKRRLGGQAIRECGDQVDAGIQEVRGGRKRGQQR
jgi:hypothetical protein